MSEGERTMMKKETPEEGRQRCEVHHGCGWEPEQENYRTVEKGRVKNKEASPGCLSTGWPHATLLSAATPPIQSYLAGRTVVTT